jgi:hypothetical protein
MNKFIVCVLFALGCSVANADGCLGGTLSYRTIENIGGVKYYCARIGGEKVCKTLKQWNCKGKYKENIVYSHDIAKDK